MVAYLGLGSNLGDRSAEIGRAVQALSALGRVVAVSALYETELAARALLVACLGIEGARGRIRPADKRKAPRIIDIDLLLYGAEVLDEPGLTIPHPSLLARPFVRIPLAEVALPALHRPQSGDALDRSEPDATVRRVGYLPSASAGGCS